MTKVISVLKIVPLTIAVLFRGYSNARSSADQTANGAETKIWVGKPRDGPVTGSEAAITKQGRGCIQGHRIHARRAEPQNGQGQVGNSGIVRDVVKAVLEYADASQQFTSRASLAELREQRKPQRGSKIVHVG